MIKYLEVIEDDLEDTAPEYEPVFTSVYQYYGNSLASFTNTIDDLLLQLPILIKLKVQAPMSLFSTETVPVTLDVETYIGDKGEYTQIIPETEYIALTDNNYVPLTQMQISCYIVGLNLNCKFIDLLFNHSFIKFIEINFHLDFIVSEIICKQTDTLTQGLMHLR